MWRRSVGGALTVLHERSIVDFTSIIERKGNTVTEPCVRESQEMFMTPIQTLYDRAVRNQNDTAFIAADDKWTFKRFAAEVHRVAHGLAARGIRKGDRIALHLPNCPELALMRHRVRELLAGQRTAALNALRRHLAEIGLRAAERAACLWLEAHGCRRFQRE
jgi:non-ribosomal peptide synthetase component E (peptide arylation enzyme)